MRDLYDSPLAQNARKTYPSSQFGTRQLQFYRLGAAENFWNDGNYSDPDSRYAAAVRGIQQYAELFFLGAPNASDVDGFVFAVADNTSVNYGENELQSSIIVGLYEALDHTMVGITKIQGVGDIIQ